MTTAREQAREATRKRPRHAGITASFTRHQADAASDVWEPLLRALVEEMYACECPFGPCEVYPHPAFQAAKEALGE